MYFMYNIITIAVTIAYISFNANITRQNKYNNVRKTILITLVYIGQESL